MFVLVRWLVFAFSLLLVVAGLPPLVAPDPLAATSQALPYAWFHLIFALVGIALTLFARGRYSPWFALGFGLLDLYQLAASLAGWFPKALFLWTPTDDGAHLIFGILLIILGGLGFLFSRKAAT